MTCSTCYQARTLPRCLGTINLGTISDTNTAVVIRVQSGGGRIDYIDATSDGSGNLVVDFSGIEIAEMNYHLSVLKASDRSLLTLTLPDAETSTCVEVGFEMGNASAVVLEAR